MGTYLTLPYYVLQTGNDLQEVIDKNSIGPSVLKKFPHKRTLPAQDPLVRQDPRALSPPAQAPRKELHAKDSEQYTDDSLRPELAMTLPKLE